MKSRSFYHFDEVTSTQDLAKDYLKAEKKHYCVSASIQSKGRGTSGRRWDSNHGSLAFSFDLEPNKVLSFTSIEIGILLCTYLEQEFSIKTRVKWPNDLFYKDQKCCGILCESTSDYFIAGVGINFNGFAPSGNYVATNLPLGRDEFLLEKFFSFFDDNRLDPNVIPDLFSEKGYHLSKTVSFFLSGERKTGTFVGIGNTGEALIKTNDGKVEQVYSGSMELITEDLV